MYVQAEVHKYLSTLPILRFIENMYLVSSAAMYAFSYVWIHAAHLKCT